MNLIEEVRDLIEENTYPLDFEPDEWKNEYPRANCYTYALGLHVDEAYLIGDFIEKRVTSKDDVAIVLSVLVDELSALGFEAEMCDSNEEIIDEDTFKIFVEFDGKNNYHFLREDRDGTWSHKCAGKAPTRNNDLGCEIENPEYDSRNEGYCFMVTLQY